MKPWSVGEFLSFIPTASIQTSTFQLTTQQTVSTVTSFINHHVLRATLLVKFQTSPLPSSLSVCPRIEKCCRKGFVPCRFGNSPNSGWLVGLRFESRPHLLPLLCWRLTPFGPSSSLLCGARLPDGNFRTKSLTTHRPCLISRARGRERERHAGAYLGGW